MSDNFTKSNNLHISVSYNFSISIYSLNIISFVLGSIWASEYTSNKKCLIRHLSMALLAPWLKIDSSNQLSNAIYFFLSSFFPSSFIFLNHLSRTRYLLFRNACNNNRSIGTYIFIYYFVWFVRNETLNNSNTTYLIILYYICIKYISYIYYITDITY